MSFESISSQMKSIDSSIRLLESQIHTLENSITRKQTEANSVLAKITREKDIKKVVSLNRDLTSKGAEITRLEKNRSIKAKALADKQKKKADLRSQLVKYEKQERENTKREHREILSLQQEITREVERQKYIASQITELKPQQLNMEEKEYDVFISHASEDKDEFVREFAKLLRQKGLTVWYDEFELKIGDSLRRKIDLGLKNSRYGIIVLSNHFFKKEWPQKELDGLFTREEGAILPIWHKITKDEVTSYSRMIAGLVALNTSMFTVEEIAEQIAEKVKKERE